MLTQVDAPLRFGFNRLPGNRIAMDRYVLAEREHVPIEEELLFTGRDSQLSVIGQEIRIGAPIGQTEDLITYQHPGGIINQDGATAAADRDWAIGKEQLELHIEGCLPSRDLQLNLSRCLMDKYSPLGDRVLLIT